jgi:hypothetical protein
MLRSRERAHPRLSRVDSASDQDATGVRDPVCCFSSPAAGRMTATRRGQYGTVAPALQAALGIVAFFALALVLAWKLKSMGTVVLAVVAVALLAMALVLQAVTDSPWFTYAAVALAVMATILRFALDAATWAGGRRRHTR